MCTCGRSRSVFNWINKSLFLSEVISVLYMSIDSRLQPTGVFNVENGSWIELYYKCSTHSYWHNSYISSFLRIRYIQTLHSYPLIFFLFSSCLAWLACGIYFSAAKFVKCSTFDGKIISLIFCFSKQNMKNVYWKSKEKFIEKI